MTDPRTRVVGRAVRCAVASGAAAAVLALLLPHTRAASGDAFVDTVDFEVGPNASVDGTLRPAEERESFPLLVPRGSVVRVTAKPLGEGARVLALDLLGPDAASVATGAPRGAATRIGPLTTAAGGVHVVRLCGDGESDGDYRLKVKAKAPRRWAGGSETDLGPGEEATFAFGAAAGSVARIVAAASKKSALLPVVTAVSTPTGGDIVPAAPAGGATRHVVRDVACATTGEYTVHLRNDGAAGAWSVTVTLAPPTAPKVSSDLRDAALAGEFSGTQPVFARSVGAEGGVVQPLEGGTGLEGVTIQVPAGAVSDPVVVSIAGGEEFFVDDVQHAGGATFEFGPSGLSFEEAVTVTVPIDTQAFDDPGSEATSVGIQDGATGEVTIVPASVDVDAGTLTFQTSHFSRFQPLSSRPRPFAGTFVELELSGSLESGFTDEIALGLHVVHGDKGPRTGNTVTRDVERTRLRVTPRSGGGSLIEGVVDRRAQSGVVSADTELTLDLGNVQTVFERGRGGDVLVRRIVQPGQLGTAVLLRRAKGTPTRSVLRGTWHALVVEFGAAHAGASGATVRSVTGQTFELDVDPLGRATPSDVVRTVTRWPGAAGRPVTKTDRRPVPRGSLLPAGDDVALTLAVGLDAGLDEVVLAPVVRGDALVGVARAFSGVADDLDSATLRLVVLVRAGSGGDAALLRGRSLVRGFGVDVHEDAGSVAAIPTRVDVSLLDADVLHDGAGGLAVSGLRAVLSHDGAGEPLPGTFTLDGTGTYRVARDLVYAESRPLAVGALLRRRGLYVAAAFDDGRFTLGFGVPTRNQD